MTYTLAALLLANGLDDEAWLAAQGAVRMTWERGYWFRTPEAWDVNGDFRASIYMRPLAIWAIEAAIAHRRGDRAASDLPGSASSASSASVAGPWGSVPGSRASRSDHRR